MEETASEAQAIHMGVARSLLTDGVFRAQGMHGASVAAPRRRQVPLSSQLRP